MFLNFLLMFLIVTTLLFMNTETPLGKGLLIVASAVWVGLSLAVFSSTTWFTFIMLTVFISGMMILFLYVASLASNLTKTNYHFSIFIPMVTSIFIIFNLEILPLHLDPLLNLFKTSFTETPILLMYKLFSPYISLMSVFIMSYLLMVLFVAVKLTTTCTGPLRMKI
uniref:NADH dehydrogenase subunit 6 n=1 Tax=Onisimus nanseni TaxID=583350 RepID=D3G9K9_ONINA|nr:NADH dehydrogenase subunit 6 [Onisimus nanseni]